MQNNSKIFLSNRKVSKSTETFWATLIKVKILVQDTTKKHLTKKMHKLPLDVPKIFLLMKNTLNVLKIKKNKNMQFYAILQKV